MTSDAKSDHWMADQAFWQKHEKRQRNVSARQGWQRSRGSYTSAAGSMTATHTFCPRLSKTLSKFILASIEYNKGVIEPELASLC